MVAIVIVVAVLDEVCVRKRFFLFHEFVVRLMFAHETGGNVRATRAGVDELVRIFANIRTSSSTPARVARTLPPVSCANMSRTTNSWKRKKRFLTQTSSRTATTITIATIDRASPAPSGL